MTRYRLRYVKKAYEKGNKLPFIKLAKSKSMSDVEYVYYSCQFKNIRNEQALHEDKLWWAEKMEEFLNVRYNFLKGDEANKSIMWYMYSEMQWEMLYETKCRLSDEFLNNMMTNKLILLDIKRITENRCIFTKYLIQCCSDNVLVANLLREKNLIE